MNKKIAAIYIPGLGDSRARGQDKLPLLLKIFKVKGFYFPFGWDHRTASFEAKLNELSRLIGSLTKDGYSVSLIVASAGASAALNAFAKNKDQIKSLSLICGKVNNLGAIHAIYYSKNPKFKESVEMLPLSLKKLDSKDRARILSIRPMIDPVVSPKDTLVKGAKNFRSFSIGHSSSIAYHLTIGLLRIVQWIKKNS
jgi:pimeloyl-ACP methyl ester carboxylesterase